MVASTLLTAPLRVLILGLFSPRAVMVTVGGAPLHLSAEGAQVLVEEDGAARQVAELRLPPRGEAPGGVLVQLDHDGRSFVRRYPGAIVARATGGRLRLLNEVDPERHAAQVIASEAAEGQGAPAAARALAIVVRSFTATARLRPRHEGAELCDTTHCALYRGSEPAAPWAAAAAAATSGRLLGQGGAPVEAYFTEACGGSTADAAAVWGGPPRPHLRPRPCIDCQSDPRGAWESTLPMERIDDALREERLLGPECPLGGLAITGREPGGAVTGVLARCRGDRPGPIVRGEALRIAIGRHLGWGQLPSARFDLAPSGAAVRFRGRGRGHGVGLCLRGALGRARAGWEAERILRAYFPGTDVLAAPR